ncbi:hypothetical protein FQN57_004928 [Myotisia sp. PD_48]|nr:hypothetical protein FQN57_004928 [Myotisia sp. PD_48]
MFIIELISSCFGGQSGSSECGDTGEFISQRSGNPRARYSMPGSLNYIAPYIQQNQIVTQATDPVTQRADQRQPMSEPKVCGIQYDGDLQQNDLKKTEVRFEGKRPLPYNELDELQKRAVDKFGPTGKGIRRQKEIPSRSLPPPLPVYQSKI